MLAGRGYPPPRQPGQRSGALVSTMCWRIFPAPPARSGFRIAGSAQCPWRPVLAGWDITGTRQHDVRRDAVTVAACPLPDARLCSCNAGPRRPCPATLDSPDSGDDPARRSRSEACSRQAESAHTWALTSALSPLTTLTAMPRSCSLRRPPPRCPWAGQGTRASRGSASRVVRPSREVMSSASTRATWLVLISPGSWAPMWGISPLDYGTAIAVTTGLCLARPSAAAAIARAGCRS